VTPAASDADTTVMYRIYRHNCHTTALIRSSRGTTILIQHQNLFWQDRPLSRFVNYSGFCGDAKVKRATLQGVLQTAAQLVCSGSARDEAHISSLSNCPLASLGRIKHTQASGKAF